MPHASLRHDSVLLDNVKTTPRASVRLYPSYLAQMRRISSYSNFQSLFPLLYPIPILLKVSTMPLLLRSENERSCGEVSIPQRLDKMLAGRALWRARGPSHPSTFVNTKRYAVRVSALPRYVSMLVRPKVKAIGIESPTSPCQFRDPQ